MPISYFGAHVGAGGGLTGRVGRLRIDDVDVATIGIHARAVHFDEFRSAGAVLQQLDELDQFCPLVGFRVAEQVPHAAQPRSQTVHQVVRRTRCDPRLVRRHRRVVLCGVLGPLLDEELEAAGTQTRRGRSSGSVTCKTCSALE